MPPQSDGTMVFWFCGGGAPFVLRVVAGACVGRWTGQPRMPPRERLHEGLGGLGDSFAVGLGAVAGACVDHGSGQARMPPQERRHEEVFGLGDSFTRSGAAARGEGDWGILLRLEGRGAVGSLLRGHVLTSRGVRGIGGRMTGQARMPPQERRHEEVFGLGDSFTRGSGARGVRGIGGFFCGWTGSRCGGMG